MFMFFCLVMIIVAITTFIINESLNERGVYDKELTEFSFIMILCGMIAAVIVCLYVRGLL